MAKLKSPFPEIIFPSQATLFISKTFQSLRTLYMRRIMPQNLASLVKKQNIILRRTHRYWLIQNFSLSNTWFEAGFQLKFAQIYLIPTKKIKDA